MRNFAALDGEMVDLRDVLERIADLELEIGSDEENDFDQEELAELNAFVKELLDNYGGEDIGDIAENEPTVVNREYWLEYVKMFAEDIGAIDSNANWPICHIDWQAAADDLEQDYVTFDFDGRGYLIRAY